MCNRKQNNSIFTFKLLCQFSGSQIFPADPFGDSRCSSPSPSTPSSQKQAYNNKSKNNIICAHSTCINTYMTGTCIGLHVITSVQIVFPRGPPRIFFKHSTQIVRYYAISKTRYTFQKQILDLQIQAMSLSFILKLNLIFLEYFFLKSPSTSDIRLDDCGPPTFGSRTPGGRRSHFENLCVSSY